MEQTLSVDKSAKLIELGLSRHKADRTSVCIIEYKNRKPEKEYLWKPVFSISNLITTANGYVPNVAR